ncbi:MAG: polysaccharide biosynthesis protein, partial [Firmicutes bacterium]|nr:polysaccharide biosynthesis protein [Bacillota bacterium]
GREPVIFNAKDYGSYINNETVLVTGGGGSIGAEICRQVAKLKPKNLIILDICENGAYNIQQELCRLYKNLNFEVEIATVRDFSKIEKILKEKNIDVIFHAAAHKHVPLMEKNPEEAVKNNVFGTLNIVMSAKKYKVKKFVLISTDKAVNPTSVMGITKRICEMIIQFMDKSSPNTEFVAVRFGNVLGSNGSVVPLFKEQIKNGGPVTVTHPNIIRYFMTIPEAVSLVLTAGGIAKGGEIFVLDMGEPVKIKDLAENLIRLSGFVPNKDIKIEYVGIRPGEKLFEELLISNEGIKKTENEKIYIEEPLNIDENEFEKILKNLKNASNDSRLVRDILFNFINRAVKL